MTSPDRVFKGRKVEVMDVVCQDCHTGLIQHGDPTSPVPAAPVECTACRGVGHRKLYVLPPDTEEDAVVEDSLCYKGQKVWKNIAPLAGEKHELTVCKDDLENQCYIALVALSGEHNRGVGMNLPWNEAAEVAEHILALVKRAGAVKRGD